MPVTKTITIYGGQTRKLVHREQLRAGRLNVATPGKGTRVRFGGLGATPPTVVDWSNGRRVKFPIDGNGNYGDCFYTSFVHQAGAWTFLNGREWSPPPFAIVARYLQLSKGDNGLDDSVILPEILNGIIGPHGPIKWLDALKVPTDNSSLMYYLLWRFGGLVYTASLLSGWLNKTAPGDVWDANDGSPDPEAGHAMYLSGFGANGNFADETWGFNPAIVLTPSGLAASDPELIVGISLSWYNGSGYSPAGFHYTEDAAYWASIGGVQLPASPFPPANTGRPSSPTVSPAVDVGSLLRDLLFLLKKYLPGG